MKKILSLLVLGLLVTSCKKQAQATVQSGNFQVEYLFENKGCKAYRFQDGSRYIYYTDCSGRTEYSYTQSSGKNGSTTHYVETSSTGKKK